ncbi:MAG TPA: iron-sulfur cluster assembly accessory protein [Candidatus Binatia bacterium]
MMGKLTITDQAAEKIHKLLAGAAAGHGLRVTVVEGGCSGFEYKMELGFREAEDEVFEKDGARVFIDPQSILRLSGTELDYKDELMQSAFVFNNPNIKGTCGCGTSFHT